MHCKLFGYVFFIFLSSCHLCTFIDKNSILSSPLFPYLYSTYVYVIRNKLNDKSEQNVYDTSSVVVRNKNQKRRDWLYMIKSLPLTPISFIWTQPTCLGKWFFHSNNNQHVLFWGNVYFYTFLVVNDATFGQLHKGFFWNLSICNKESQQLRQKIDMLYNFKQS